MDVIRDARAMSATAMAALRDGKRIGFVPTMGFLHEGHLSLVRLARAACDMLVVSIFVNPTQFGPGEDLTSYPRDIDRDEALCGGEGVDIVFCPDSGEMYAPDNTVYVVEENLTGGLCGASRPGHFRGVLTVVAKLFNIVRPHVVVFGQKDAQQARTIEQMIRDLNFPIEMIIGPIVREPDGLAMSSRNAYLTDSEREQATCLHRSLLLAERMYCQEARDARAIRESMRGLIEMEQSADIDYIETVDYRTLKAVDVIEPPTLVALAVRIGRTRLIDNMLLA